MAYPVIETATGAVNGANRVFEVSADYVSGSVRVWLNGQLLRQDLDDGWDELGGRRIRLKEAPRATKLGPDTVRVYYIPIS